MSKSAADIRRARAAAEAAEWAVRLDSTDASMAERAEFMDWLRESPLHVSEMLRIGRLTSALAEFGEWQQIASTPDVAAEETATIVSHSRFQWTGALRRDHRRRVFATIIAIAASALIIVGVYVGFRTQLSSTEIHTQSGERREVTLSDGSVVRLSPNTDLSVYLQPRVRSVVIARGEALFRVAKDASRPFVVDAARAKVQAIGTMFSVARNDDSVIITVTEGVVRVTPGATSIDAGQSQKAGFAISLVANERVSISDHGVAGAVRKVESTPVIDWGDNRLVFENATVADVVNRFNRRNSIQILLSDSALGKRTVSGIFDAADPQSFVDFLQSVTNVTSTKTGDQIVVTTRAEGSGPDLSKP
jgi:transmembrane sensor